MVVDLVDQKGYIVADVSTIVELTKITRYVLDERVKEGFYWSGRYVVCVAPEIIQSKRKNSNLLRNIAIDHSQQKNLRKEEVELIED